MSADPDAHLTGELPSLEESAAQGSNSPIANSRSNFSNSRSSSPSRSGESKSSFSSKTNPDSSSLVPSLTPTVEEGEEAEVEDHEAEVEELLRLHRAGEFPAVDVTLALPHDARHAAVKIAVFFELVYGLRLAACDNRPVPFGCEWAGDKTGIPKATANRALHWLVDRGVLVQCVPMPGRKGKRGTFTYLPADQAAAVGVEAAAEVVGEPDEPHVHVVDESLMVGAELAGRQRSAAACGDRTDDVLRGGVEEASGPGRHLIGSTSSPGGAHPSLAWSDPEELVAALIDAFDAEEIPPDLLDIGSGRREPAVGGKRHAAASSGRNRHLAQADGAQAGEG